MRFVAKELERIAGLVGDHECRQYLIVIYKPSQHNKRLTRNFMVSEFACKDGSPTILIDKRLSEGLQKLREIVGKPVKINSAYRHHTYNVRIGSDPESDSRHLVGQAADIVVAGMSGEELADIGVRIGFTGIGIAADWCHLDVRDKPARWRY